MAAVVVSVDGDRLDLRLLLPALVMWAVVAAFLAGPTWLLVTAALLGLVSALVLLRTLRTRPWRWRHADGLGPTWRRVTGLALALAALGLIAVTGHRAVRESSGLTRLAADGAVVTVTGRVVSEPVRISSAIGTTSTVLLRLRVEAVIGRGALRHTRAVVLVRGDDRLAGVALQSRLQVTGRLSPLGRADPEVAALSVRSAPRLVDRPGLIWRAADVVRERLRAATAGLPEDAAGLVPALVVGDTSGSSPALTDAMRATGLAHLSAVSGANVAITLTMVLGVARWLGVRRRFRPVVALASVAAFVVLARPEPSVLRAAVMGSVVVIGTALARRSAGPPALGAAIVILLVIDPWLARSYGFALSVLATLGLLVFVRSWGAWFDSRLPVGWPRLGQVMAIPAAAALCTAPIVVLLQGTIGPIGLLANLLAAPLVAPATIGGVATALVSLVWPAAARLVAWTAGVPAWGIAAIAHQLDRVPGGQIAWPDGWVGAALLAGITVAGLLSGPWLVVWAARHRATVVGLVGLSLATFAPTRAWTWPPASWVFAACDVGQGDALVLRTGPGSAVLVDAGPDPSAVDECLSDLSVTRLDAVVLTHFHADHVDGLSGAVQGRQVGRILTTPVREPGYQSTQVERLARVHGIPIEAVWAGDDLFFGSLRAHVWWPARRIAAGSVPNNASVVLTVTDGGFTGLLLGDVEREASRQVLLAFRRAPPTPLPPGLTHDSCVSVDVLKVAHHGSSNLDPELLDAVCARVAVISVGADNDYGHPAPSTLSALHARGYAVWRTDLRGSIAVAVAPTGLVSSTR